MHENILSPAKKEEKKTKQINTETHDFSTPTEWNVEMVNAKVIVTLSGGTNYHSTISRLSGWLDDIS